MSAKPATTVVAKSKGKGLDEFRASYDKSYIIPNRLKEALKLLKPQEYEDEGPFFRTAGVSPNDAQHFREQFKDVIVEIKRDGKLKRLWCGSAVFAQKLREMV